MMIGAAIVSVRAGHAVETDGVSSNVPLKSSGSDTLVPRVEGPSSQFKNADNAKADPVETIKPYPMRMVRMRPSKAASPLVGIPLGRPGAPDSLAASASAASSENAGGAEAPAASPQTQSFATAAEPAVSETKKRRSSVHARRQREDENENARSQSRRAPYWGAYAEDRYWRGTYRTWVY